MVTEKDFLKTANSTMGNPRYILHFLQLKRKDETSITYERALSVSRQFGGTKCMQKSYGGGILFSTYNLQNLCDSINNYLKGE